jgi:hypothetical protein
VTPPLLLSLASFFFRTGTDALDATMNAHNMTSQPRQDDPRLVDLVKDVASADAKNAESFDKAILTLSSGALALSLAFTKDIVSPATAEFNALLYAAWAFFMFSLAVNVVGFMRAFRNTRQMRRLLFDVLRHGTRSENLVQPLMDKHLNELYGIHFWQGALFLSGATTFTIYVMLNFHHEATMTKPTHNPTTLERAQPSTSFFPQATKPAQAAPVVTQVTTSPSAAEASSTAPAGTASQPASTK